jgi:hypothetical protein
LRRPGNAIFAEDEKDEKEKGELPVYIGGSPLL